MSAPTLPPSPSRAPLPTLTVPDLPAWPPSGVVAAKPTASASVDAIDQFAIQVASFTTQTDADSLIEKLSGEGFEARSVVLDYGPPLGQLVQVLVGGYPSPDQAHSDLTRMRERFRDARIERVLAH